MKSNLKKIKDKIESFVSQGEQFGIVADGLNTVNQVKIALQRCGFEYNQKDQTLISDIKKLKSYDKVEKKRLVIDCGSLSHSGEYLKTYNLVSID